MLLTGLPGLHFTNIASCIVLICYFQGPRPVRRYRARNCILTNSFQFVNTVLLRASKFFNLSALLGCPAPSLARNCILPDFIPLCQHVFCCISLAFLRLLLPLLLPFSGSLSAFSRFCFAPAVKRALKYITKTLFACQHINSNLYAYF